MFKQPIARLALALHTFATSLDKAGHFEAIATDVFSHLLLL